MPGILTVTTPASNAKLTTLVNAKADLGITTSTDDAYIGRLIDRASAALANYCSRAFGAQTLTETFRYDWQSNRGLSAQAVAPYGTPLNVQRKPLILSGAPIVSITSVTEGTTLVDPTEYEVDDPGAGLLYRLRSGVRSWWSAQATIVVYVAGFTLPGDTGTAPSLPADIEDAALSLVRSAYYARARDPNVKVDMLNGDRTEFFDRGVGAMTVDGDLAIQMAGYAIRGW